MYYKHHLGSVKHIRLVHLKIFKLLILYWVEPINNVVIVSSEQQRDLAHTIHVSILPHIPLPPRLPQTLSTVPRTAFIKKKKKH